MKTVDASQVANKGVSSRMHFKMTQRSHPGTLPAFLLALVMLSCGPGAEAPKQSDQARAILDSALKRYRALRSYRAQIELQLSDRMQKPQNITFAFQRPNKLAFINEDPVAGVHIVSDGEHLYTYLEKTKNYTKIPIPPTLTFTRDTQETFLSKIRCSVPALIMLDNPEAYVLNSIRSLELEPPDSIGTHLCDVLRLMQNNNTVMQLWIDKRAHIIRKSTTDMTPYLQAVAKQQGITPPATPIIISELHKNIELNEPIPDEIFEFTPPAGAQELAQPASSPRVLVGHAAPAFTLQDLEGNTYSLQSLNGKVAIVSFWTMQNRQSVSTLSLLQALHERYGSKGLFVLGVTNEADVKATKSFLKDRGGTIQTDLNRVPTKEELVSMLQELGIS